MLESLYPHIWSRNAEKEEGDDLEVKLHAGIFFNSVPVFLCDGLAAAAKAGFQFSKHLGFPDLPCLLNVCKSEGPAA